MPPQTPLSATSPIQSLYPTLIRPIIAPDFYQPLLADAITYLDPLIEDTTIFTAAQRIREIGVEVDATVRSLRRAIAGGGVNGDDSASIQEGRKLLEQVRGGRLRSRLDNFLCIHGNPGGSCSSAGEEENFRRGDEKGGGRGFKDF